MFFSLVFTYLYGTFNLHGKRYDYTFIVVAGDCIASFPGSCVWAERKEPGKHCLRMLRYTNLHEARRLLPYKRCLPLTTLSADNDEGAMMVLSSLLAEIGHAFAHSS